MKEKQVELKKVRLETLLFATMAFCFVWAVTVQADIMERKPSPPGDCSSAIHFSKIRHSPKLATDLRLYQLRTFSIQKNYPELGKKSFGDDRMRAEFSVPENRIKIDFSKMSSVMRLFYSLARWGTLAPVSEVR